MLPDKRSSNLLDEAEIRFGLACALVILTLLICGLIRLPEPEEMLAIFLVTAWGAITLTLRLAAFLGLVAWAFFTGFVTNDYGQLSFARHDLVLMATLIAAAALASRAARRAALETATTGVPRE